MAKENITPTTQPTEQDIEKWKKEHDEVHKLTVGDKTAYLHDPNIQVLSLALSKMANKDVLGSTMAILENCWLGGDEEIRKKPKYIANAIQHVQSILGEMQVSMEKL